MFRPFSKAEVLCVFSNYFVKYRWKTMARKKTTNANRLSKQEHCMELVRKYDHENYLCCLLMPQQLRACAFAVGAFNVEVAQIRDIAKEDRTAQMRIHFWKDTIERIFQGSPPETPVALELAKALDKKSLSKRWFLRVLEARESVLTDRPYSSVAQVETYAENSVSSIYYILLESLGVKDVHADHAASHIGKAQGITTLVRAVPFHAQKHKVYLPVDVMLKHQVSQEEVVRGSREQKMKDVIFDIASAAHRELDTARSFKTDVPKEASIVFLQTVCVEAYLKALQKADFEVFDARLQQRNNWLPLLLWMQRLRETY